MRSTILETMSLKHLGRSEKVGDLRDYEMTKKNTHTYYMCVNKIENLESRSQEEGLTLRGREV